MADRSVPSSSDTELAAGWAGVLKSTRWTGMLAGDVICATVPWLKESPVIAPQVDRLTRAVACCQVGFLRGCTESPSFPCVAAGQVPLPGARQRLQDGLDLCVARVVGVLEQ